MSMENLSLEFLGTRSHELLGWLLVGVAGMLVAYGLVQLARRRWRDGGLCIAAVLPPVLAAALALDALRRARQGNARGARSSLVAAAFAALGTLLVGGVLLTTGEWGFAAWMALLTVQIVLAVAVFYAAVYAYLGTGRMTALLAMRAAAIAALLLLLFKPAVSVAPDLTGYRMYLPVLVDRSGSMETADGSASATRYARAIHALGAQDERLREHFRPVWMHFATDARSVDSWDELARLTPRADGSDATDLAAAIRTAAGIDDRRNLAGILLLSDGIHNAPLPLRDAALETGVPVYTVGLGSDNESETGRRNLRVLSVETPFEAMRNNVARITVRVQAVGFQNLSGELRLLEEGSDVPLATEPLWTDKGVTVLTRELKYTPRDRTAPDAPEGDSEGEPKRRAELRKLRVEVVPNPAETVTTDNAADLHVLVTEPRIRVLYVEGSIRPEYKFLRRALDTDQNVQLLSLIRIQKNRFSAAGAIDGRRLVDLPRTKEDFALFDVIVLGDLDSTFLSRDQRGLFRDFVNDGGGLVMLGGLNSFGPGGYGGTEIEEALPVTVGPRAQPQETTPFLPQLTAFGQQHPVFDGIARYFRGPNNAAPAASEVQLPELLGGVTFAAPKPAATVLAVHPTRANEAGPLIVLAVQPYGAGRSAAFAADTTWQWYLPLREMGADSPYLRFWGQLIRWLADVDQAPEDAAPAVVARVDSPHVQAGKEVTLRAFVQDARGQATDTARVSAVLRPRDAKDPSASPETVPLALSAGGVYEAVWRPATEGAYDLHVTAASADGVALGGDELPLTVAPASAEMDRLARDADALRTIAETTGGRYADIHGLPELLEQIVDRQLARGGPVPTPDVHHLYHFTALFLVFVALLTGEWLLRRRWQLQ